MDAELKYICNPDASNLESYFPEDNDDFCILIQAFIGPHNGSGEECFNFLICTPRWVEEQVDRDGVFFGKAHLVIKEYNYMVIVKAIKDLCSRMSGKYWNEIANKLSRFGDWEFEGYSS